MTYKGSGGRSASRRGLRDSAARPRLLSTPRGSSTTSSIRTSSACRSAADFHGSRSATTSAAARPFQARSIGPDPRTSISPPSLFPDDPASASMVTLRNSMPVRRDPQKPTRKKTSNVDVLGAAVGNLQRPNCRSASSLAPRNWKSCRRSPCPVYPAPTTISTAWSISAAAASSPSRSSCG